MSTDDPTPTGTPYPAPPTTPAGHDPAQPEHASVPPGEEINSGDEHESWFGRHVALLVAAMAAIVVAAASIAGVAYYRGQADDRNAETEAAFMASVEEQGATVVTVECDEGTCAAIIGGQAYTVLVQEDEDGEQQFGVSAFVGD